MSDRPCVSVIVPFAGSLADLQGLLAGLAPLSLRDGDELIVADNRARSATSGAPRPWPASITRSEAGVRIHRADGVGTPGFARNCGARVATGEWLVFIDSDTRPSPSLVADYFRPGPLPQTAVLAGAVLDVPAGTGLVARRSVARHHMSQRTTLTRGGTPYAQTANCAILRSAFVAAGGFDEGVRAGEDADLCFRLARAGWRLEERPRAQVEHRGRDRLAALLLQLARHGSGAAWLNRRYPGEFPPPGPRELIGRPVRGALSAGFALVRGEPDTAVFALLDLVATSAFDLGRLLPNRAPAGKWTRLVGTRP